MMGDVKMIIIVYLRPTKQFDANILQTLKNDERTREAMQDSKHEEFRTKPENQNPEGIFVHVGTGSQLCKNGW